MRFSWVWTALLLLLVAGVSPAAEQGLPLPVTSEQLAAYYVQAPDVTEFYLRPEYAAQAVPFSREGAAVPRQGHFFGRHSIPPETRCYRVGRFPAGGGVYGLVVYNNVGEADTVCLNVELLGYDGRGTLRDALLIENRYGYEDVECHTAFEIDAEGVSIDYYVTYVVYVDEGGNMADPVIDPKPELFRQERYRFTGGRFELTHQREWEPQSWRRPER